MANEVSLGRKFTQEWDEYHMGFAEHAATGSKGTTKVGAVLVHGKYTILSTFNGPASGVNDTAERRQRPKKYIYDCHAEENIISLSARRGITCENGTVYTTHAPCANCARMLVQAGIKRIVFGPGKTSMPQELFDEAATMCAEAGVALEPFKR